MAGYGVGPAHKLRNTGAQLLVRRPSRCHLAGETLDLGGKRLILGKLSTKEGRGHSNLFLEPLRREDVRIRELVRTLPEVTHLHPSSLDQRAHAVVDLADADAKLAGKLTLRCFRVLV